MMLTSPVVKDPLILQDLCAVAFVGVGAGYAGFAHVNEGLKRVLDGDSPW